MPHLASVIAEHWIFLSPSVRIVDSRSSHIKYITAPRRGLIAVHLREFAVSRMNAHFGRRQSEDQPPTAGVHRRKAQLIAEKCTVGLRILAVEKKVNPVYHKEKVYHWP